LRAKSVRRADHAFGSSRWLRNPTALAFDPGSGALYAIVQERDGLGDRLLMTRLAERKARRGKQPEVLSHTRWPILFSSGSVLHGIP
jgi:hypothetical protein